MKYPLLKLLLALAPIAFVAGCGGGGGDDNADDRLDIAEPKVRFIHAMPAGPDVTLYRDGAAQADATGVGYKFASKYDDVPTSTANWSVKTATGDLALGDVDIEATRGNKYTIVALPGATVAELAVIRDPYNKSLTSDQARVRVLNASVNLSEVDVYLTPAGTDIAGVAPTFSDVAYQAAVPASDNDSLEFSGGTYQLRVTAKGSKTALFSAPVNLADNADWLLLTLPDLTAPGGLKVLIAKADDASQTTQELVSQ